MAPIDDDWSDSDEEVLSEVETSVLLGIPDGTIDAVTDIKDAAVSRMGGYPVRYHQPQCILSRRFDWFPRHFFLQLSHPLLLRFATCVRTRWSY